MSESSRQSAVSRRGGCRAVRQEVQVNRPLTALALLSLALAASVLLVSGAVHTTAAPAAQRATLQAEPPTVDNFDRADEDPLSDGGKWSVLWGKRLKVVSNRAACTTIYDCAMWRTDVRYGLDHEVVATVVTKPGNGKNVRLYVRLQKPTGFDGYSLAFIDNSGTDQLVIEKIAGGGFTALAPPVSQEIAAGDKLRLRAVGSTLEAWRYSAGGWSPVASATDSTYLGIGYVGLGLKGTGGRLDDFGAATLREAVPPTDPVVDNFNRPDEDPLSDGGKWALLWSGRFKIASNQAACTTIYDCAMWRTDVRYGLDQEAAVTIETKPDNGKNVRLYARLQLPYMDGYALFYQANGGIDEVRLERIDNGGFVTLATFSQELLMGDRLRLRAVDSTIEAWRHDNYAGAWVKLGQATDSTYLGIGYVGFGLKGTGGRLDNFGSSTLRAPIPSPGIPLDDFNRPNEDPLSDSGKWAGLWNDDHLKVVSNQVACTTIYTCQMRRSAVLYEIDQEAWVTIETKPDNFKSARLYVRIQSGVFSGYALRYQVAAGVDQVMLELVTNGAYATLQTFNQEVLMGDKLRLRAVGSTIEAWRYDNNVGLWTKLGEVSDSTYSLDGYVGLGLRGTGGRLDDFGGGDASSTFVDDALLNRYAPELRYYQDEQYRADSARIGTNLWFADPYRTVVLRHLANGDEFAAADPDSPLDNLSLGYLGSAPAGYLSQPSWFPDDVAQAALDYSQWVSQHPEDRGIAYGRVIPDGGSGDKILQYWMYYYYNPKDRLGGGNHEGDWEWMHVRLNSSNIPISVALSQHGSMEKCFWGNGVQVSSAGRPVVYVAWESHANFFWPGLHEQPFPIPIDVTSDDGPLYREIPSIVNVTSPPGWIVWTGAWGDSSGVNDSPLSPGRQDPWEEPWAADGDAGSCTPPALLMSQRQARPLTLESKSAGGRPTLPRIVSARITNSSRGKVVRVRYCYRSMPADAWRRPALLHLALENVRDKLPPLSVGWTVKTRCGTILHPVGPLKAPYLLRYSTESRRGTFSARAQIRLP